MKKIFFNIKSLEKKINIAFFTSNGGVSKNNFFSLNCSESSGDNKKSVRKNIKIALQEIKINNKKLKLINQVHSNKVFFVNKKNYKKNIDGDGLITDKKDLALGILTADCAPIFIFDINQKIICNLHSGWKSAFLNIVKQSIKKIKSKKILTKNLIAVIGPCLEYNKFEVDKNFKYKFI